MKKILFFVMMLFGLLSIQLMANFNPGTNSYDYGCGVGVPPSVCGASGGSKTGNLGNSNSKSSCSSTLKSFEKVFFNHYKKNNPNKKVTYKFVEKVPNMSKVYAYKFIISDKTGSEEIRFAFDGETGSIYRRIMSESNSKFELIGQEDLLICN